MINENLKNYIQTQIIQSHKRLKGLANDMQGNPLFKRFDFFSLKKFMNDFLERRSDPRIIIMPGLRGTGKTTLLAQLFLSLSDDNIFKLYLSVDEVTSRFNANLWDIIENYEELQSNHIEELDEPFFLFLDEIHYDKKWAIFLKTLYDRSKNIMVFCTGSSALLLREQINADVARRVFFMDIWPISFLEYMLFKNKKHPPEEISGIIKDAMFSADSVKDAYAILKHKESKVKKYWLDIDKFEIQKYITLGTLPFTVNSENEVLAMNFVSQIINKVIFTDIPQFMNFEVETLNKIEKILYLISDSLGVSAIKLSSVMEMKIDTLSLILKSLENAGLLIRIPPYGAHFNQVRKPSKYLFATPALRFSYLSSKESI
ncbi:ATP-binding protein, partial [Candidatus Poribacteria bacterium]|nr:ATP-binding protein [Candidatus Poribacteria bacterium]